MVTTALVEYAALFLMCGVLGGFLSGLLGIGSGSVYVPALYFVFGMLGVPAEHVMHMSVGTSLTVIVFTLATSAYGHYRRGSIDQKLVKNWAVAVLVGVVAGNVIAGIVDGGVLKIFFLILTVGVALYMGLGKNVTEGPPLKFMISPVRQLFAVLIGMVGPLTGMSGGVLSVPVMLASGTAMQKAVGTAAAICSTLALLSVAGYIYNGWDIRHALLPGSMGYVSLPAVACIVISSIPMAPVGVRVSHKTNKLLLRRIFAVFLVLVSLKMLGTM